MHICTSSALIHGRRCRDSTHVLDQPSACFYIESRRHTGSVITWTGSNGKGDEWEEGAGRVQVLFLLKECETCLGICCKQSAAGPSPWNVSQQGRSLGIDYCRCTAPWRCFRKQCHHSPDLDSPCVSVRLCSSQWEISCAITLAAKRRVLVGRYQVAPRHAAPRYAVEASPPPTLAADASASP